MRKTITIMTTITLLGSLAASAQADTCTFAPLGSTGIWNDSNNWDDCFGQTPDANDTAIIPFGKTCRIVSATTEDAAVLVINNGSTLEIEDDGRINLHGPGNSIISGDLLFRYTGSCFPEGCCDPASPNPAGTLHIEDDLTITNATAAVGFIEGRCEGGSTLNPGVISGDPGVTLTLDANHAGGGGLKLENYLRFDVKLDIPDIIVFQVDEPDQLMEFDEELRGEAEIVIADGTVQVDACMVLTWILGFLVLDAGGDEEPQLDINAVTCSEAGFVFDKGTMNVNADFISLAEFRLGPFEFSAPNGDNPVGTINVASGVTVSFPRTGGTCPLAFCD